MSVLDMFVTQLCDLIGVATGRRHFELPANQHWATGASESRVV